MGMNGYKDGRNVTLVFLKDQPASYDRVWPAGSKLEKRIWPDEKDKDVIWFNEGQGDWYSMKLGVDCEIEQAL